MSARHIPWAAAAFLLVALAPATAEDEAIATGELRVQAILVAEDLSLRPVPKHRFLLEDAGGGRDPLVLTTGFDGAAAASVPPGDYVLRTETPVSLSGKSFHWEVTVSVLAGTETTVELSNDNARIEEEPLEPAATGEGEIYERLSPGVFKVIADGGHGSGFLISDGGLVLTNHHVVAGATFLAIKVGERAKHAAVLMAADSRRDLAVLRLHPDVVAGLPVLPLAEGGAESPPVAVGDRVMAIGSPLTTETILTSGIVSKVEDESIYSDVDINEGNSGGPLLDLRGRVVGITTFGIGGQAGPGVSGIVRIHAAVPLVAEARAALEASAPPDGRLLPVAAAYRFSPDEVRDDALARHRAFDDYHIEAGKIDVQLFTPVMLASQVILAEREAAEGRQKRKKRKRKDAEQPTEPYVPGEAFYEWQRQAENFRPVVRIRAFPEIKMKVGSAFGAAFAGTPAKYRFKTDFLKMELRRDGEVVEPIHPGRIKRVVHVEGAATMKDIGYFGYYEYPPEAFRPGAAVTLTVWEEGKPKPWRDTLEPGLLQLVNGDFAAYFAWLDGQDG